MNDQQACRERGTELFEIKEGFETNGKRYESLLIRLTAIGNRLVDESGVESGMQNKIPEPASKPMLPGGITDFQHIVNGFSKLADRLEQQISKLEKII